MKKIHLLLLKSFIRPFVVTLVIVMFVLLMLFLFKYIDDLIGKGFQWYIILELMMYNSATNVAMALPLSVLLSSIMTYGSLGENYELVAIKSAGISLRRAMYPMMVVVVLLSIAAFAFSDYMLPVANLKYYSLLYDARQQKSADLIPENVFSNRFPGYTIRVKRKDPDGQTLYDIMIYQGSPDNSGVQNVTFAKSGLMYRTKDNLYLVLKLKDGIRYQEDKSDVSFNPRQRFTRFRFKETEQKFDLSGLKMKRTDEGEFRNAAQMMNLRQLKHFVDSAGRGIDSTRISNYNLLSAYLKYTTVPVSSKTVKKPLPADSTRAKETSAKINALNNAISEVNQIQDALRSRVNTHEEASRNIRRYMLEYQKKFTLGAACIVLFLIGAPLGAIIRKGGLGLPVVVSVIFFLIYYIIGTIGEKSAKEGDWSPVTGAWVAIAILLPIGLFLSYKAATDSTLFDIEAYKRFFGRLKLKLTKRA
ncbi:MULTISPECIES: LptF/LptG family permease [unclassified Mucilaginibacter]|uniref:LptF/LptG family permease n=1 Tax=unclassified Mucilaginibacter TaxID=2617802 RepID=UPI00096363B3|nr:MULTISPECIES: LptF/LptG family permease [unclassified Mucilaginibacter]OJW15341.1 MAG: permease [Mucilaginibacter sp. 44-25]PLW90841.1 MAG: permease [Mucilaginibacter sp.]HEK19186.1 YjgP/YjgQ family permease [Bacteroidota bacterium]